MKTEILTKQDFQPIELKITIETKRELETFLAFMHPNTDIICKFMNDNLPESGYQFTKFKNSDAALIDDIWARLENINN